jgi:hypothetical protein
VHFAGRIQQAFNHQSSEQGKLEACAVFATIFCQQASKLCPARAIPGIGNGWPEELEIAAKEIYVEWDRSVTNNLLAIRITNPRQRHVRGLQHVSVTIS